MRRVDRVLGRPLAALLTAVRRVLPEPRRPAPADVRRVLFVKLSEMGAVVLAAPAFAEVEHVFPGAEVWLLCFDENAEIAETAAGIPAARVLRAPSSGAVGTLLGLLRVVRRVRALRFDVVVDLEYLSRVGAVLTYLSGAPVRSGFHRFAAEGLYCGDLYTHRLTFNPYLHIAQSMVTLVRAAARDPEGAPLLKEAPPALAELRFPRHTPQAATRDGVLAKLRALGVPDGAPLLLVNPNSSDLLPLRRWPVERFVEVCRILRDRVAGAYVVLTGAPHEAALGGRILELLRTEPGGDARCVSLIGQTDLRELLSLFTLARVLVSADSGPPHFAVLTDLRVVTLFGPETPALYGPVNDRNRALTLGLACSPCIHAWNSRVSTCTDNRCMREMDAAWVAETALRQIADAAR